MRALHLLRWPFEIPGKPHAGLCAAKATAKAMEAPRLSNHPTIFGAFFYDELHDEHIQKLDKDHNIYFDQRIPNDLAQRRIHAGFRAKRRGKRRPAMTQASKVTHCGGKNASTTHFHRAPTPYPQSSLYVASQTQIMMCATLMDTTASKKAKPSKLPTATRVSKYPIPEDRGLSGGRQTLIL